MNCEVCKRLTVIKKKRIYHYDISGLDNVYLQNVEMRMCERCRISVPRIPRILQLHATIAKAVVMQPALLGGKDIRFLRKELGMRAREFAKLLRTDVSTFSRWEKNQKPGPQSDLLIRYLYIQLVQEKTGRPFADKVAEQLSSVGQTKLAAAIVIDVNDVTTFKYASLEDLSRKENHQFEKRKKKLTPSRRTTKPVAYSNRTVKQKTLHS